MTQLAEIIIFGMKYRTDQWNLLQREDGLMDITLCACEQMVEMPKRELDKLKAKAQSSEEKI